MSVGWEPDDMIAIVHELCQACGEPALLAVERALARTAAAFGRVLRDRDGERACPEQYARRFANDPRESCTVLEASSTRAVLRTTRCPLADAFRALGRPEVGYRFKCSQDFHVATGYDPTMRLTIPKCLMRGEGECIHEFERHRLSAD
jgi:hypothetical protein